MMYWRYIYSNGYNFVHYNASDLCIVSLNTTYFVHPIYLFYVTWTVLCLMVKMLFINSVTVALLYGVVVPTHHHTQ